MIVEKKGLKLLGMNNKESILMELKTRTEIDDGNGNGSFWLRAEIGTLVFQQRWNSVRVAYSRAKRLYVNGQFNLAHVIIDMSRRWNALHFKIVIVKKFHRKIRSKNVPASV